MSTVSSSPPSQVKTGSLIPALGLFSTVMLVIGGVIGSGIFRKPGVMASQVGSPELLLVVWVLAGVITLFGALTNAEIASMIPETGGQYVYFERMYGPFFGFLYGWAMFVVVQSGSIAAVAYVFAEYSTQFVPLPHFPEQIANWSFHLPFIGDISPWKEIGVKGVAAAMIILLTAINYIGVKFGGLVQNIFTIAKVAAMMALMLGVLLLPTGGSIAHLTQDHPAIHLEGFALFASMAAALQGAFWAYDGWNKVTYVAGEVKQPQRNIPFGLLWGMLAVTGLYVLMNVAYCYVLPIEQMAQSKLVAADVAEKIFSGGGRWIALAVMLSTFGASNAIILATARVYFSMAQRNTAPAFLGRAHPRFRTPGAALLIQGLWSALLLFSGTFDTLTDTLIFVMWVFYAAGAYGVFVLRRKEPGTARPYKVPGYPWVPAIFVIFAVLYLGFTIYNDIAGYRAGKAAIVNCAFGTVLVLVGTPIYWLCRGQTTR